MTYTSNDFAVYSADQAESQDLYQKLIGIGVVQLSYYYSPQYPIMNFPYLPILSAEARMLWTEARNKASSGSVYYARGDFENAKTSYQSAYNLANQSLSIEAEQGKNLEDEIKGFMDSVGQTLNKTAESTTAQTQALLILSVGLSIGVIMIGLGTILYGLAKRKTT